MASYNYPYVPPYFPQQGPPMQPMQANPQNVPQPMMQQQQQQNSTPQIQNGGFISVRNEDEARSYPVAIGNSVTFKDENAPYVYTKTMGFSQLDRPIFEKYRLVKEGSEQKASEEKPKRIPELDSMKADIRKIWDEINEIKETSYKRNVQPRRDRNGDS